MGCCKVNITLSMHGAHQQAAHQECSASISTSSTMGVLQSNITFSMHGAQQSITLAPPWATTTPYNSTRTPRDHSYQFEEDNAARLYILLLSKTRTPQDDSLCTDFLRLVVVSWRWWQLVEWLRIESCKTQWLLAIFWIQFRSSLPSETQPHDNITVFFHASEGLAFASQKCPNCKWR